MLWRATNVVVREQVKCVNPKSVVSRIYKKLKVFWPTHGVVAYLYLKTEPYNPDRHADSPIGAYARVSQHDLAAWDSMSRHGWQPVVGWVNGEWIIQRALWRTLTPEEFTGGQAKTFAEIWPVEVENDCEVSPW
jgi:hypothetical protein